MQPNAIARRVALNMQGWRIALNRTPRRRVATLRSHRQPWAIAASLIFVAAALALVMFAIDAWTIAEMRRLPRPIIALFDEITDFGKSGWFLFPLALLLLAIAVLPPTLPRRAARVISAVTARAGFLFVAIAVPGLCTLALKYLIGRARPYAAAGDPHVFNYLLLRSDYASLPSGHATTAFAAAAAIGAVWPKARMVAWVYALVIGASRVIVTAHFPSDVIAGAVIGVVGATLVRNYFAVRGLVFSMDRDGHVRVFAGPSLHRLKAAAANLIANPNGQKRTRA